jgi:hypothetical protein
VIRLVAASLALVGLAAACSAGGDADEAAPPPPTARFTGPVDPPEARPLPPPPAPAQPKPTRRITRVVVNVVDGDTHERIQGARVVIGAKADYSNPRGRAYLPIRRRTALPVRVSKPGYAARTVRMPFKQRRRVTVRLFRPALQWTMYGANERRTQAHPEIKLRPPFKVVWSRGLGALVEFPAVIADGVAYVANYKGSVNGRVYGTPAVAAGRVFVPSSTGNSLTAFTTSGRRLWRVGTGGYVYSSPAVWGGRVFFGSYNGRFYSVSAVSGRVLWSVPAGGPVSGAAVVVGGVAYAGSTWGRITGVDAKSGRVLLRFPHGEYVPVSGNGRRLLLHGYSRVWAVEPAA